MYNIKFGVCYRVSLYYADSFQWVSLYESRSSRRGSSSKKVNSDSDSAFSTSCRSTGVRSGLLSKIVLAYRPNHTHTHTHLHTDTFTHTRASTHTHTHICMLSNIVYTLANIHTYIYLCMYTCLRMYDCVYICMHVSMYVCIILAHSM